MSDHANSIWLRYCHDGKVSRFSLLDSSNFHSEAEDGTLIRLHYSFLALFLPFPNFVVPEGIFWCHDIELLVEERP